MAAAKAQDSKREEKVAAKAAKQSTKTKRQKRMEGSNPSTAWPQQPKIKSMEARDKAYLRIAGFGNVKKTRAENTINPDKDFINSPEYKFGRLLASPETRTRHATILKLKQYLQARTDPNNAGGGLSVLDLMKLWKGMWHTLYLCDGVAVQTEVSKVLAELMWAVGGTAEEDEYAGRLYLEMEEGEEGAGMIDEDEEVDGDGDDVEDEDEDDDDMQIINMEDSDEDEIQEDVDDEEDADEEMEDEDLAGNPADDEETKHCRGAHLSALYVRTYLRTLTREWSNMDKYRIDKFYTLTRLILREIYRYAASRHWNLGIIRLFNDAIFEEVLRTKGNDGSTRSYGNGIRFHILDICLEELAKVNAEKETGLPLTEATFLDCLEPFFAMAQRCEQKLVHQRVVEKILMRFLEEYSVVSDNYVKSSEGGEEKDETSLIMDQVHVGTVGQFIFELGSDTETADRYRSQLYDIHKTYMRRIKLVGRDVDLTEEEEEVDEEDVQEEDLVEEDEVQEEVIKESNNKKSKSKKKKKKKDSDKERTDDANTSMQKDDEERQKASDAVGEPQKEAPKKKRKKKKKSSNKEKEVAAVAVLTQEEEEIITISKKEQKAAAKAVTKAAKVAAKAKTTPKTPEKGEESGKRVKFKTMNSSKSYKASIKDLKKVNPKTILEKTPEKSILLKRDKRKRKKGSS